MNHGFILEKVFYEEVSKFTSLIYTEKELKRMYGWDATSIDFLIICDNSVIAIQTKYRKSRRRENKYIANFIKSLNFIKNMKLYDDKKWSGIWVSRRIPFEDNIELLKINDIICSSHYESSEGLVNITCELLHQII
jgi:hypothetical protein